MWKTFFTLSTQLFGLLLISASMNISLECNVSIICGSLPEIRPFFMRFVRTKASTGTGNTVGYQPSNVPQTNASRGTEPYASDRNLRGANMYSTDSLSKFYKWTGAQDSLAHIKESNAMMLEEIPARRVNQAELSREKPHSANGSHGSEEMWVSGGDGPHLKKNIPGTRL